MKRKPFWKNGLILLATLVVGIFIGRLVLGSQFSAQFPFSRSNNETNLASSTDSSRTSANTNTANNTKAASATQSPVGSARVSPKASPVDPVATCISALTADTKKEGTEYEKGVVIVSFKTGTTFDKAKATLTSYNLRIENEDQIKTSFSSNRVANAVVPMGEEIKTACKLRQDAIVYYAGLNTFISIHE